MKNAIIYARSATFNKDSLHTQIVLCKKFAADNGYKVIRVFIDTNTSGRSVKRPALHNLFKEINSHGWETVIILNYSCFFKNTYQYIKYMQKLNLAGKRIIIALEQKEILQ